MTDTNRTPYPDQNVKNCPFCGGSSMLYSESWGNQWNGWGRWVAECCRCKANIPAGNAEEALGKWNQRIAADVILSEVRKHV